ncbi:MAG: glycosyltransferase family 39 protein [Gemmatimonadota bacterium]
MVRGALLLSALVLGLALRLVGLTRGNAEWPDPAAPPGQESPAFYTFHPDEETLISAGLRLTDPTNPPLTAYGALPMLLARGTVGLAWGLSGAPTDFTTAASRRPAYYGIRAVAVLISLATLWGVWALGLRLAGEWAAGVAVAIVAVVPLAVQQAHFYTVDGLFTLLTLGAALGCLRALDRGDTRHFALAGLLIGAAAAVRLNGALMGIVLAGGHLCWPGVREPGASTRSGRGRQDLDPPARLSPGQPLRGRRWVRRTAALIQDRRMWAATGVAAAVLLALQPYLLLAPGRMSEMVNSDDFAYSLRVARGEILRPWSLADYHTTPYLHYWTHLWPLAVGWPLTWGLGAAAIAAAARRRRDELFLLAWLLLYFGLVGGLHTKHVRYLLPMLPFLAVLAGSAVVRARRLGGRLAAAVLAAAVAVGAYTALYGAGLARIYDVEDSRITAARWAAEHIPADAVVGVERGGFSMERLVAPGHRAVSLEMMGIFGTRGFLSCAASADYLAERVRTMDYLAIVDVNRYRQFVAAPELYPAAASFYRALIAGQLGLDVVQRFRAYPAVGGIVWRDDDAEPSFTGFDHPTVMVLRRSADPDSAWATWRRHLADDERCPDRGLERAAAVFREGDMPRAGREVDRVLSACPQWTVTHFLAAQIGASLGEASRRRESVAALSAAFKDRSLSTYLLPWAAARTYLDLDLPDLAVEVLGIAARDSRALRPYEQQQMGQSYAVIGNELSERGREDLAQKAWALSAQVAAEPEVCNVLARLALAAGRDEQALAWWGVSLQLDPSQRAVHGELAEAAGGRGDTALALEHLEAMAALDTVPDQALQERLARLRSGRGTTAGPAPPARSGAP